MDLSLDMCVQLYDELSGFPLICNFKVSGPRVQTFCNEKDPHMEAILRVNTFKWCFSSPKQRK